VIQKSCHSTREENVPDRILLEEYHLTLTAPPAAGDDEREAMRRALNGRRFRSDLRRAVRELVRSYPALAAVRVLVAP
jgi:hypothetical protein